MKKSIIIFGIMATILISFHQSSFAGSKVSGYYRKDGTYVQSHYRSSPNDTKRDNWSTYGNTNPHTGEDGTKNTTITTTMEETIAIVMTIDQIVTMTN